MRHTFFAVAVAGILACGLSESDAFAQVDLRTILIAGVNQSTIAPSTSEVVYEASVTLDPEFLALMVAEATAGASPGEFIPAPAKTQVRTFRSGERFRVEIDAIEADGSLTPNSTFICDGRAGVRYTSAVPASLRPGIAEILAPERAARLVTARGWEEFFQPKRRLPLGEAESKGYRVHVATVEPMRLLGYNAYGITLEREGETATTYVAPQAGFLPLTTTIRNAQGQLVSKAEVLRLGQFGGKTLPAEWVCRRYQGDRVVSMTEIKVLRGAFDQPIDDTLFQLDIPEGFRVKQVGR